MHKPLIIGIGGAHSAVGKTTLSAAIIRHLTRNPSYLFSKKPRFGAVKYTRTELYSSLIEDESVIKQKDKDTARLSDAGAQRVLWIKSPSEELEDPLSLAFSNWLTSTA